MQNFGRGCWGERGGREKEGRSFSAEELWGGGGGEEAGGEKAGSSYSVRFQQA